MKQETCKEESWKMLKRNSEARVGGLAEQDFQGLGVDITLLCMTPSFSPSPSKLKPDKIVQRLG